MYKQINLWENVKESTTTEKQKQSIAEALSMPDAEVVIYRYLFSKEESNQLFSELYNNTNWKQESIKCMASLFLYLDLQLGMGIVVSHTHTQK